MGIVIPLLAVVALGALTLKLLSYLFSGTRSANPFEEVVTAPVREKVLDQKKRDAVLKQGFGIDKVPDALDAIVIGSGIGGLSTAAIMAKAGKKVLVLEQHDQAGGCCHTYIDKGYEFDVGIHYIGELQHQSVAKTYLDQITNRQLTWEDLDDQYDEIIFNEPGKEIRKYPVWSGEGKWAAELKKAFPGEEDNIDKFFNLVEEVHKGNMTSMLVKIIPLWAVQFLIKTGLLKHMTGFYDWNSQTVREVVWGITENQELRDIFCYNFGDFGTPPSKAGFPMQALLHRHFIKGASYPVGGASEIAFHIIPAIEAAGGKVLVRAEVTQIVINGKGEACGVQVKKGKEVYDISAPMVISNAGVYNTFERLLPNEISSSSRIWPLVKSLEHGPGAMSIFVGIDCPAEDLDILHKKNAWVFTKNDIDKLTTDYLAISREESLDVDIPLLFISFPSTKDPEWNKKYKGKTTMAIVTLMPFEWVAEWQNERVMKRGDDYESIKKIYGHKAVEQACQLFPSIKDHIDYVNIGTPITNLHYLAAPQGEIYGLDHTRERFSAWTNALLRPKTDIPGLLLTGQDICSCGFSGALWGGLLCASAALERNLLNDLVKVHKLGKIQKKVE